MSTPQEQISAHYRALVAAHGGAPAGTQMSAEGQRFRFEKLLQIADLGGASVLDLGCGTGAFYPHLVARFPSIRYTGLDVLPEMAAAARRQHPGATFVAGDVLRDGVPGPFDYVLLSAMFNNARTDAGDFMPAILRAAFAACTRGLGFNFISTHVNHRDEEMAYHDPVEVMRFCVTELSKKVALHHHYERCDVSVFVYR